MSDPGGQVDENGVYKNASLGKAAGRTKNGTFAIKPVPKVHIDPSDAVFLLKGSRPFGRRKGGPLLDELAISKENMRKEAEAEAERKRIADEEERIRREEEAEQFVKELEMEGLQAVEDAKDPKKAERRLKREAKRSQQSEKRPESTEKETVPPQTTSEERGGEPMPLFNFSRNELPQSPVRADLSAWFTKLEKLETSLKTVENVQVRPLQEKLDKTTVSLKSSQDLASKYKSRCHALDKDLVRLQKAHAILKEKHNAVKENSGYEIKGLTFKVAELQEIVNKGTKNLEAKIAELQTKLNETHGLYILEKKNVRNVEKRVQKAESATRLVTDRATKAEGQALKSGKEAKLLKAKLSSLKSKMSELEKVKDLVKKQAEVEERSNNERKRLMKQLSDLEKSSLEKLKAAVEEREKLEFKVAELKVQVAKGVATEGRGTKRFEKKIRQLTSTIKQVEESKATLEVNLNQKIEKMVTEFREKYTAAKSKVKSLQEENRDQKSTAQSQQRQHAEESNNMAQQLATLDAAHTNLIMKHTKMCKNFEQEIAAMAKERQHVERAREMEAKHLQTRIGILEGKKKEKECELMANKEKDGNEISRLQSWVRELENRMEVLKAQHDTKIESMAEEAGKSKSLSAEHIDAQNTEIELLQKRIQLAQEGHENARTSREREKTKMLEEFEEVENEARKRLNDLDAENEKLREHISGMNARMIDYEKNSHDERQLLKRQIAILESEKKDAYAFKYMDDEDSKLMTAVVQLAEAQSKTKTALVETDSMKQKIRQMEDNFERERADAKLAARMALKQRIDMDEQIGAIKEEAYSMHRTIRGKEDAMLVCQRKLDEQTHRANCLESKYNLMMDRMKEALKEDERQITALQEQIAIFSNDSYRLIL